MAGLVHGNRGRTANNRVDEHVRVKIQELAQEEYKDYNDSHFTEELIDEHDFDRFTLHCAPHSTGYGSEKPSQTSLPSPSQPSRAKAESRHAFTGRR
jgi:hypothetical protein